MTAHALRTARFGAALLAVLFAVSACGGRYIESPVLADSAKISKTDDHYDIVRLMEEYARALEALDLTAIGELVSADYYENAGTTDRTEDDYGYSQLMEVFETLIAHIEDIRVDVKVLEIDIDDDRADVMYDYSYNMLFAIDDARRWENERNIDRVQLRNEIDGWRIISGL